MIEDELRRVKVALRRRVAVGGRGSWLRFVMEGAGCAPHRSKG
jgi:hypothetical protein